jgi:chemotaxis regulatin CheY-phosphate phosphatase CheZ
MSKSANKQGLSEEDYGAIEAAVMETSRGRWFLAEYARRNRQADTSSVLDAIGRLERAMAGGRGGAKADRLRFDLIDMAGAIARAKAEIAAIGPAAHGGRIAEASNELDAIVKSTEVATSDILAAAEQLQEVAWTLREAGVEAAACDLIDQRATDIYTACSFQDMTGQRTHKVIQVMRYLEDRLAAMLAIAGRGEDPAPRREARGTSEFLEATVMSEQGLVQGEVDAMLAAEPLPLPAPPAALPPPLRRDTARPGAQQPPPTAKMEAPPRAAAQAAAMESAPSPFAPVVKPKPKALAPEIPRQIPSVTPQPAPPVAPRAAIITLAQIEALSFEEKAALFS